MYAPDPIRQVEKIVKEVHDGTSKYTQPVLARYPLVFAFLVVFSVAAIMHGFKDIVSRVAVFAEHPWILMGAGIVGLLLTGKLYNWLKKGSE